MPFGDKPACSICQDTTSTLWRKTQEDEVICNNCFVDAPSPTDDKSSITLEKELHKAGAVTLGGKKSAVGSQFIGSIRKSARLKPSRHKFQATSKPFATKGKSRRVIFKKNVIRAPASVATVVTSDYIFYDELYYQIGDVVSVMDVDGGIYYAQLRGFLQDQYCKKSAVITWLLPTTVSPKEGFDPSSYILGPEEDLPRDMDCFEFVAHAPSEYFGTRKSPYPTLPSQPELGYVWTAMGPEIAPVPTDDEIYGLNNPKKESQPTKEKSKDRARDRLKKEDKETVVKIE